MAHDEWRLRIELEATAAGGLLSRLGRHGSSADDLAHELELDRLAVSQSDDTIFVYADSSLQIEKARQTIESEMEQLAIEPLAMVTEHWLGDEDRWDDEPAPDTIEAEALAAGYAPWEVRIPCESHEDARELADQLESEGYGVVRRFSFVIAGTATREEAEELARKLHGQAGAGSELVWEVAPGNPFAIFGGLGGDGTPI
jgi:hypothetical protein